MDHLPVLLLSMTTELNVISIPSLVLEGHVLRTNVVLDGLRGHNVGVGALHHLVGVYALVTGHVDWQRVITQGLHLVNGQVTVRLVAQCVVLAWKEMLIRISRNCPRLSSPLTALFL